MTENAMKVKIFEGCPNEQEVEFEIIDTQTSDDKTKVLLRMDGQLIKVHAIRQRQFGSVAWTFTGSHANEDGKAVRDNGVPRVMNDFRGAWIERVNPDARGSVDERFNIGLAVVANRVVIAIENFQGAEGNAI